MIFILDSNFFIDAHRYHLPLDGSPEFWTLLANLGAQKIIAIPREVYNEICKGDDILKTWLKSHKDELVDTDSAFASIRHVINNGYSIENEIELENLNADPFVIALAFSLQGTVVTSEKPRPGAAPRNKKIPDVCRVLNVPCISITRFIWEIRHYWLD